MGNYIKELYDYNESNNCVWVNGEIAKSPTELQDALIKQFNDLADGYNINEFDFEEFAYDVANNNLDLILERVLELSDYVESLVEGYPPLFALSRVIILRYLNSIKNLIANERSKNDNLR